MFRNDGKKKREAEDGESAWLPVWWCKAAAPRDKLGSGAGGQAKLRKGTVRRDGRAGGNVEAGRRKERRAASRGRGMGDRRVQRGQLRLCVVGERTRGEPVRLTTFQPQGGVEGLPIAGTQATKALAEQERGITEGMDDGDRLRASLVGPHRSRRLLGRATASALGRLALDEEADCGGVSTGPWARAGRRWQRRGSAGPGWTG